jgi:hypothetical protein
LKYVLIGLLFAAVFLLIYYRIRPYIALARKILSFTGGVLNPTNAPSRSTSLENKLQRCVACGTWVPADRAISVGGGQSIYCSTECLENVPSEKRRKNVG